MVDRMVSNFMPACHYGPYKVFITEDIGAGHEKGGFHIVFRQDGQDRRSLYRVRPVVKGGRNGVFCIRHPEYQIEKPRRPKGPCCNAHGEIHFFKSTDPGQSQYSLGKYTKSWFFVQKKIRVERTPVNSTLGSSRLLAPDSRLF
jgi:hypothetical protein